MQIVLKENRLYQDLETRLRGVTKDHLAMEFHQLQIIEWDNFSEHPINITMILKDVYELLNLSVFNLIVTKSDDSEQILLSSINWDRHEKHEEEDVFKHIISILPDRIKENMVAYKFITFGDQIL